jgi:acyl-CoA thioesterase
VTEPQRRAERVVERMLAGDTFSRWLGIEVVDLAPARCRCRMTVRDDMVNGFGVAHGAVAFALADSALAFASNTSGFVTLSIDNAISYPVSVRPGDVLTATATADAETARLGFYTVPVTRADGTVVAIFRGTVYRTAREHLDGD